MSLFSCLQELSQDPENNNINLLADDDATQMSSTPVSTTAEIPNSDDESLLEDASHWRRSTDPLTPRQKQERQFRREIDSYTSKRLLMRENADDPRPDIYQFWRKNMRKLPLLIWRNLLEDISAAHQAL